LRPGSSSDIGPMKSAIGCKHARAPTVTRPTTIPRASSVVTEKRDAEPRWRKPDSNPRSPAMASSVGVPCHSTSGGV
jgi:hypothetical protein